MSVHVVIGAGVAGHHHERVLGSSGREVDAVLDAGSELFGSQLDTRLCSLPPEAVWHVCTPTHTHITMLERILAARPEAPVVLEKPIGNPGEAARFAHLAAGKRIMVQSQYSYARVVELLAKTACVGVDMPRIEVFSAKQREASGRFVDLSRQAVGYEAFHHIAIVVRLVEFLQGEEAARAFLCNATTHDVENDRSGYSFGLAAPQANAVLQSRLDRSGHRKHRVQIASDAGEATLEIESQEWLTGFARQTHVVRSGQFESVIVEDLIATGIECCVRALLLNDRAAIKKNQDRAVSIEMLLDRVCAMSSEVTP